VSGSKPLGQLVMLFPQRSSKGSQWCLLLLRQVVTVVPQIGDYWWDRFQEK